jgi:hypothetical protein
VQRAGGHKEQKTIKGYVEDKADAEFEKGHRVFRK